MNDTPHPRLLGLPLDGLRGGRLVWQEGEASVRDVLTHILLTRPGERLMRPGFGAGLARFLHHPDTLATRSLLADAVRQAVTRWEPRIELLDVRVAPLVGRAGELRIDLHYRLRSDGREDALQLVLPGGA